MKYLSVFLFIAIISCSPEESVFIPDFNNLVSLKNLQPITENILKNAEGIYEISPKNDNFGSKAVVKANNDYLSIFCESNSSYIILKFGKTDSSLIGEGYWRYSESSGSGRFNSLIEGISFEQLIVDKIDSAFQIKGKFSTGSGKDKEFSFKFQKKLNNNNKFYTIAHRGGGRNSDNLPHSENSIELMKYSSLLGANAIEIDIQNSKDNIPFIYHDSYFSTRLIDGEFLIGPTENFTLKQIKAFGKLKKGEEIPTLDEALNAVVFETNLELVWVDVKSVNAVDSVVKIIEKYQKTANNLNRDIKICFGIPSVEVANEFLKIKTDISSICELSVDEVLRLNSIAYGSPWTLGILKSESEVLKQKGKSLFVWTLDEKVFIQKYLKAGIYNGIVTNYPALVTYNYYMMNEN